MTFASFRSSGPFRSKLPSGVSAFRSHYLKVMWLRGFARFCNLAFPAEHITIRASEKASTLFCKIFYIIFLNIRRIFKFSNFFKIRFLARTRI